MRLLNSKSIQLELLHIPPARYAIISHRWRDESEEVLFTDIGVPGCAQSKTKGYYKMENSCAQATQDGLDYVWLDTCCIDSRNSAELMEAINSMYKWYRGSTVCYVYLHDVSNPSEFLTSDWFTRGWTLQELIAPRALKFFTKDWHFIGTREGLIDPIAERTGISPDILRSGEIPPRVSISQKMFWAAKRETTRVEDRSYSLLGILGISMVPIYGTGDGAFEDLQYRLVTKRSDQTLFAWYHTFTPPEDVEMADADLASGPAPDPVPTPVPVPTPILDPVPAPNSTSDSAPKPAPESAEDDANTPPLNITGLLAFSPSHYLKAYEIPERDFRKYYVDSIRDYGYRSQFSISNNLVRISLPMKHVAGRLWKAVLRCSFDPPGGDQIQRPLVIYLKEIQPSWKFARVHIAPEENEEMGDGRADATQGVSGSLERLRDAEVHLHGYILRDIDIVARGAESSEDSPPKEPPSDPHSLPVPTDAERVAHLPRHPPGVKTTNILVCGEPGVASGRVINFILGHTVLKPLTDYERETMAATVIDATLRTLRNTHRFVQLVRETGGIHLMVMCMVGSRPTPAVENNYRLFYDGVCRGQVPMILVITGLGKTQRMEDWWEQHKGDPELAPMARCVLGHACITVLQGDDEEQGEKYRASREMVQRLVREFMARHETAPSVYCPEDVQQWFVSLGRRVTNLLLPGQRRTLERETVKRTLMEMEGINLCGLEDLVRELFDERAMVL